MKPILLGVNIDHVATLRQARGTPYPDPVEAAQIATAAGADSITAHLREDRRHIQDRDVYALRRAVTVPLNLELAVTGEMLRIAAEVKPAYCCFVPERREELTTEGGLDVRAAAPRVREACAGMAAAGILASLFIDADEAQIRAAAEVGARVIEIHTGHYADAAAGRARDAELARVAAAVALGRSLGLTVNAGHGLNYDNVGPIAALEGVHELNIGHAIVSRAVLQGLGPAVAEMKRLLHEARA